MKPYNSLSDHLKERFGTISKGGCIFCSGAGSGDFAPSADMSISNQLELSKQRLSQKWPDAKYIAYFQAFTNTYAPVDELERKYEEALSCDGIDLIKKLIYG